AFEDRELAETRWSDEAFAEQRPYGGMRHGSPLPGHPTRARSCPPRRRGAPLGDGRAVSVAAPPARAFAPIQRIGGKTGWYAGAVLWRLRGLLDVLVGGPGLRR